MSSDNERKYVPQDDVYGGVKRTVELLNYMLGERTQLYGTIIYLMQMLERGKVVMPPVKAMQEYHNSFYVKYDIEEEDLVLMIIDRESLEGSDNGEQS